MRKVKNIFLVLLLAVSLLTIGCSSLATAQETKELILVTTTSTFDSGLLDYLLPHFEKEHNYNVNVISLGTGAALEQGKNGDADVVLVHAKLAELKMVDEGHFVDRIDVMYNDFVLLGPDTDPVGLKDITDINAVFAALADNEATFISRGDDSGTHKKELSLWEAAELIPTGDWYVVAGLGMGDTLTMANEKLGYCITDRATYLAMRDKLDLVIVFEGDKALFNQYGIMAVNPVNYPGNDYEGATLLINFFESEKGQELIANFKPYGDTLFFPNAK